MKWLVFLLSTLLVLSCSKKDKGVTPTPSAIWPLKIGNQWTYVGHEFDSTGNTLSSDTTIFEVMRDTIINNKQWFIIYVDGSYDPEVPPITNRADGVWQVDALGKEWMAAKYPAAVNDSFQWGDHMCYVELINDTVTVPAGKFTCYRYRMKRIGSTDPPGLRWISPDKGWVKEEEFANDGGGQPYVGFRFELQSLVLH